MVGKTERRKQRGRPRRRWGDKVKMDLKETGYEGVVWINLAHGRVKGWAVAIAIINLQGS
jgi:hypothetical protein